MTNVMIGTPIRWRPSSGYMMSLICMMQRLTDDITLELNIQVGSSDLARARNQIVRDFMNSENDVLVWIDDDITWQTTDFHRLIDQPYDMIGGAYPARHPRAEANAQGWHFKPLSTGLVLNDAGICEVRCIGTGFLKTTRNVYKLIERTGHWPIFMFDGVMGEDERLCGLWREADGRVYLDPEIDLEHEGMCSYSGDVKSLIGSTNFKEMR